MEEGGAGFYAKQVWIGGGGVWGWCSRVATAVSGCSWGSRLGAGGGGAETEADAAGACWHMIRGGR